MATNPISEYVRTHTQRVQGCTCEGEHDRWKDVERYIQRLGHREELYVEPKIDGTRRFLMKSGATYLMASKHNGLDRPGDYPELFKQLEMLSIPDKTILDGELKKVGDTLYVFDVLTLSGEDIARKPLRERKNILREIFRDRVADFRVKLLQTSRVVETDNNSFLAQIKRLFDCFLQEGYEGCVIKDPEARYGGIHSWQKVRAEETADYIVSDKVFHQDTRETSYKLSLYDKNGKKVHVGNAYSCIAGVDRSKIKIGTVVEVRHQPTNGWKKLRFPTILRVREDKSAEECLLEQVPSLAHFGEVK